MIYKFREIWKTVVIDGVEHPRYKVSNLGRVKCLDWNNYGKPRMCALNKGAYGYLLVGIDGSMKYAHRIVAETFLTNFQNKPEVDHVDTNRKNNCVWNLRWVTSKENSNNPITNRHQKEEYERNRSIPIVQLTLEGQFVKKWVSGLEVYRKLGIKQPNIVSCCKGRYKTMGGFKWMYYSDWLKTRRKKSLKDIKPLFV